MTLMAEKLHLETASEDRRWQAVLNRDTSMEGAFVYGVRSTGVYCRPDCPSRRPGRGMVVFFDESSAAVAAGFRACKRCHPDEDPSQAQAVARVRALLDASEAAPGLAELATATGLSPSHLLRVFKKETGLTPRQYAAARRVERLKSGLRSAQGNVTTAMYDAGFGSSRALYEIATGSLGMRPRSYKNHGRGEQIRYGVVESSLGPLMVAATERGVCFVGWGERDSLIADLRAEFSDAAFDEDTEAILPHAAAIEAWITGSPADVRLDIQGTPFQLTVWAALAAIPRGETRTYGELAATIGHPNAARAVGRACALNLVAPVIPCHRAVGSSGDLTGYRWGVERKRALLAIEQDS